MHLRNGVAISKNMFWSITAMKTDICFGMCSYWAILGGVPTES